MTDSPVCFLRGLSGVARGVASLELRNPWCKHFQKNLVQVTLSLPVHYNQSAVYMLTILFSSDFRFLKSCGSCQDQHIHYMQVVCNFPVKIKFWREIILAMTFAYICYVGDPCVTFFNRSGDHLEPRS